MFDTVSLENVEAAAVVSATRFPDKLIGSTVQGVFLTWIVLLSILTAAESKSYSQSMFSRAQWRQLQFGTCCRKGLDFLANQWPDQQVVCWKVDVSEQLLQLLSMARKRLHIGVLSVSEMHIGREISWLAWCQTLMSALWE